MSICCFIVCLVQFTGRGYTYIQYVHGSFIFPAHNVLLDRQDPLSLWLFLEITLQGRKLGVLFAAGPHQAEIYISSCSVRPAEKIHLQFAAAQCVVDGVFQQISAHKFTCIVQAFSSKYIPPNLAFLLLCCLFEKIQLARGGTTT